MKRRAWLTLLIASVAVIATALPPSQRLAAQDPPASNDDPFLVLRTIPGTPMSVPPRALAVIPERHAGRMLVVEDYLIRVEPQFDDLARGLGLDSRRAIQFRTRDANIPFFVAKTPATITVMLQVEINARLEMTGALVERGGRYLFLASDVHASGQPTTPANRGQGGARRAP